MSTSEPGSTVSSDGATPNDPAAIREEIERTREDLADTVDALHAKLDVKAQVRQKVAAVRDQATTADGKPRPELVVGAVAVALLVVALVRWRRR